MEPDDPDPTRRFSDRAGDYARYRPGYPAAAIDAALAGLAPAATLVAADVGAGTGIFTQLLAARGVRVLAIEPNRAMREAAVPHPGVTWYEGTAEATGLPGACCDVVTVAQAFHWFRVPETLREFHRVLRASGRLVIAWNHRSRDDEFTRGYREALEALDCEAPAERNVFDADAIAASGRFAGHRQLSFVHGQAMTVDDLVGRARSTSTVPKSGPRTERLLAMLRELHARCRGADGRATMVHRTDVHLWDRVG